MRLGVEAAIVEGVLVEGDVEIAGGYVAGVAVGTGDGGRGIAVPGFVDLQVNGFGGVDFAHADAAGYLRACERMLETGVTAFQPTFITASEGDLLDAIGSVPTEPVGPRILGVHLEGPFISPERLGAHPAAARRDPDVALLRRLLGRGRVAQMTLAPELPGALELVDVLRAAGVVVSLGHTNATAEDAYAAFERGATTVTHLFNAMRPFRHRDPGIVGAALVRDDVVVQAIFDGVHLEDETARIIVRAAPGRLALVTDAISAAGMGDGRYTLSGSEVVVEDGVARRGDGTLAGSVGTMLSAVQNMHALGVSLVESVAAATSVPARVAGAPVGVLREGGDADVVVLDDNLEILRVLVAGRERVAA